MFSWCEWDIRYKENTTKYRVLTWKPRSHVGIMIYRTWPTLDVFYSAHCLGKLKINHPLLKVLNFVFPKAVGECCLLPHDLILKVDWYKTKFKPNHKHHWSHRGAGHTGGPVTPWDDTIGIKPRLTHWLEQWDHWIHKYRNRGFKILQSLVIREFKKLLRRHRRQRRFYILPTILGILLGHLLCLSLSKLSRN